jgi:hypothetical protein
MLEANLYSADGFRLGRVAAWLLVAGVPQRSRPDADRRSCASTSCRNLAELAAAQDWNGLLVLAGQIAAQHPLYLDATRYLAVSLENLGPEYEMARAPSCERRVRCSRAPELPNLTFINAVPSPTTTRSNGRRPSRRWGGGGGGRAASPVDKRRRRRQKLFAAGQTPQAIGVLSRVLDQVSAPAYGSELA